MASVVTVCARLVLSLRFFFHRTSLRYVSWLMFSFLGASLRYILCCPFVLPTLGQAVSVLFRLFQALARHVFAGLVYLLVYE